MPVKKATTRKTTAKKKPAAKKPAAKKTAAKKKAAPKKKVAAKKPVAKKKVAAKKAAPKKTTAKKKAAPKKKTTRKLNPALMKPVNPDSLLGAVVGNKPMPRSQITKKLWDYIKKHKLQDATNRRMINADDNLKAVFGGKKKVNMFEMTKLVSKHIK